MNFYHETIIHTYFFTHICYKLKNLKKVVPIIIISLEEKKKKFYYSEALQKTVLLVVYEVKGGTLNGNEIVLD